jgi:small GTP-binding protein
MVEMATHGGYLVPAMAISALVRAGAREALPGEFTRRAVLNGKLDLVRAEAVGDLIDSRSGLMHQAALAQLDGGLSRRIEELRRALIETEALIAYDIDFPEEDDGPIDKARILESCDAVLGQLRALLSTAPAGELVREGAITVLVGAPNAGKSSLYNALLGESRAIVTEIPGTTRDALEATIDADGWPLRLVDTAGLRESTDILERLGMEASERYLARAHVVLACGETPDAVAALVTRVAKTTKAPTIGVYTKHDLVAYGAQSPGGSLVTQGTQTVPILPTEATTQIGRFSDDLHQYQELRGDLVADSTKYGVRFPGNHPSDLVTDEFNTPPPDDHVLVTQCHESHSGTSSSSGDTAPLPVVAVSAVTGEGLGELRRAVVAVLIQQYGAPSAELPMLTRARHARALETAHRELAEFRIVWSEAHLPAPVAAVHLREAVGALEALIGAVDTEDVLDRVFSSFCVGK